MTEPLKLVLSTTPSLPEMAKVIPKNPISGSINIDSPSGVLTIHADDTGTVYKTLGDMLKVKPLCTLDTHAVENALQNALVVAKHSLHPKDLASLRNLKVGYEIAVGPNAIPNLCTKPGARR